MLQRAILLLHAVQDCSAWAAGASLAAAVLVPNVEFIFGLTGSTAAALLAFIFPAWVFLLAATPLRTSARADLDLLPCAPLLSSGLASGIMLCPCACCHADMLFSATLNELTCCSQLCSAHFCQVHWEQIQECVCHGPVDLAVQPTLIVPCKQQGWSVLDLCTSGSWSS